MTIYECPNCKNQLLITLSEKRWGNWEPITSKDTFTSLINARFKPLSDYSQDPIWRYNEEPQSKQSPIAKKKATTKNGELLRTWAEETHSDSNGEISSIYPSEDDSTSSKSDTPRSTSDTISEYDHLEFDPPIYSLGNWNMSGGTGTLVLERVEDSGTNTLITLPRNSINGGMVTPTKKSSQLKNGPPRMNAQHRFSKYGQTGTPFRRKLKEAVSKRLDPERSSYCPITL